jgi:hypothetical protein
LPKSVVTEFGLDMQDVWTQDASTPLREATFKLA